MRRKWRWNQQAIKSWITNYIINMRIRSHRILDGSCSCWRWIYLCQLWSQIAPNVFSLSRCCDFSFNVVLWHIVSCSTFMWRCRNSHSILDDDVSTMSTNPIPWHAAEARYCQQACYDAGVGYDGVRLDRFFRRSYQQFSPSRWSDKFDFWIWVNS